MPRRRGGVGAARWPLSPPGRPTGSLRRAGQRRGAPGAGVRVSLALVSRSVRSGHGTVSASARAHSLIARFQAGERRESGCGIDDLVELCKERRALVVVIGSGVRLLLELGVCTAYVRDHGRDMSAIGLQLDRDALEHGIEAARERTQLRNWPA